jgi:hypothetical protein
MEYRDCSEQASNSWTFGVKEYHVCLITKFTVLIQVVSTTLISLITVEVGISVEGGIFWKKVVHKCNKWGVEGGKKSKKSINMEGGFFFVEDGIFQNW